MEMSATEEFSESVCWGLIGAMVGFRPERPVEIVQWMQTTRLNRDGSGHGEFADDSCGDAMKDTSVAVEDE